MPILKRESSGPEVTALQQRLKDLGFDPKGVDGHFGPGTEAAVIAFQKSKGLDADGKVGPATRAALSLDQPAPGSAEVDHASTEGTGATAPKTLGEADYAAAAELLKCDVPAIKAVAEVESRGAGFLPDGRPKILFERHKFHKFTGGKYDRSHPGISNPSKGGYGQGGAPQWKRFDEAAALDRTAAVKSCSWGKFQVMGFNFEICGFANVEDFYAAMQKSEGEHLKAFCNYIAGTNLGGALRKHQWAQVAAGYNGAEYKINKYDVKLAAAYKKYSNQ